MSILMTAGCFGLTSVASAQVKRVDVLVQRSFAEPSDPARELFNVGQTFYDQFRFADAEKTFRDVVVKYPKSPIADRAEYYLIRTLAQNRKQPEALDRINSFQKSHPKSPWIPDVQEIRIQLTNQVPARVEVYLLRPLPQAPPAPSAPVSPFASAPTVVFTAGAQFGTIPGVALSADPQISLQQEMIRALYRVDVNRAIQISMGRLKADRSDPVVLSTLDVLATSASTQALPFLLDVVKNSPSVKARKDAIFWISQTRGDKDATVDALTGLLSASNDEDSDAIAFALSQIRTDKAFNALAGIARDKARAERLRTSALFSIGQSRMPNRVALLENIYKNSGDNVNVRAQTLFVLSQTRDSQAAAVLGSVAASDPDFALRKQAVFFLGQMKTAEAGQTLENLLQKK
jgi:hypothetical protein